MLVLLIVCYFSSLLSYTVKYVFSGSTVWSTEYTSTLVWEICFIYSQSMLSYIIVTCLMRFQ